MADLRDLVIDANAVREDYERTLRTLSGMKYNIELVAESVAKVYGLDNQLYERLTKLHEVVDSLGYATKDLETKASALLVLSDMITE